MDVNNTGAKYCLPHGEYAIIFTPYTMPHHHINDDEICYGEFAECEPPPPLTDEEWKQIFETRGDSYATETI